MTRSPAKAGVGQLTPHELRWIVDPLTQHADPCPFDSLATARRLARENAHQVLTFWRREYSTDQPPPPHVQNWIGE